jgi:hypothetical protein
VTEFTALLQQIRRRFPSDRALAKEIGITPSRLSRALHEKGDYASSFNALNCLRLAHLSGEPAGRVLRAAGKSEYAELLEKLYRPSVSDAEREVLALWDELSPARKASLLDMMQTYALEKRGFTKRPVRKRA